MANSASDISKTVEFAIQHVFSSHRIPERIVKEFGGGRWELQNYVDYVVGDMVLQLRGWFASQPCGELSVAYPADWWEAVKERFAPEWFTRRYPVRYLSRTIKVDAMYPKVQVPEKCGPYIRIVHDTGLRPVMDEF